MLKTPSMLLLFAVVCTITVSTCMSFSMTDGSVMLMFMLEFAQVIQTNGRTLITQQQKILLNFFFFFVFIYLFYFYNIAS